MSEKTRRWGAPVPINKGNVPDDRGETIDPHTGKTSKSSRTTLPATGVPEDRGEEPGAGKL